MSTYHIGNGTFMLGDCFERMAGSVTTAIAAERSGRRWCCIERDEGYYARAVERVINEVQTGAGVP